MPCHLFHAIDVALVLYRLFCDVRVVLATEVVILWFSARFAPLIGSNFKRIVLRVSLDSVYWCRRFIRTCDKHLFGQVYMIGLNITDSDVECLSGQDSGALRASIVSCRLAS